jgi:localization factor PodJL
MKHQLPWNVNGIPSDARDAARAAASREGVSVGDWLTRRILSETVENKDGVPFEDASTAPSVRMPAVPEGAEYSSEPPGRSEPRAEAEIRRLDETLRVISRRLDLAEQAQDQTSLSIRNAAAEITAATQDQSKTFTLLTRRIEEAEDRAKSSLPRDAVRGLQQGVTQLAEHFARTVAEAKAQTERLAGELARQSAESTERAAAMTERIQRLAGNNEIASIREQLNELGQFMDERFGSLSERVNQTEARVSSSRRLEEKFHDLQERVGGSEAASRNVDDLDERVSHAEQRLDLESRERASLGGRMQEDIASLQARIQSSQSAIDRALAQQAATGDIKQSVHALEARIQATENFVRETLARQTQHTELALTAHASARTTLEQAFAKLDSRISASETALKEALDRQSRAGTRIEDTIATLEAAMKTSEARVNDSVQRHLDSIERNLTAIVSRLERSEQSVASRLEATEKSHRDALAGLHNQIGQASAQIEALAAASRPSPASTKEEERPAAPGPASVPLGSPSAQPAGGLDLAQLVPAPSSAVPPPLSPMPGLDTRSPAFGALPGAAADADPLMPQPAAVPPEARDFLNQARRAARAAEEAARRDTREPARRETRHAQNRAQAMADTPMPKGRPQRKYAGRRLLAAAASILFVAAGYVLVRSWLPQTEVVALAPTASLPLGAPLETNRAAEPSYSGGLDAALTGQFGTGTEGASALLPLAEPTAEVPPPEAAPAPPPRQTARAAPPRAAPAPVVPAPKPLSPPPQASPLQQLTAKAESGDAKAALVLGVQYADGEGVAVNDTEALRWLRMAAEAGEAVAQYRLGTFYEKGRATAADLAAAAKWYQESAKLGNRKAMHNLAVAYADGSGLEKNFAEAARWFKNAAELGLTDSQFNLAVLYERGLGVQASLSEAYKWYAIAMASGDTEAKSRVDALATQLPPAEKTEADRAIKSFKARAIEVAANDPPAIAKLIP